MWVETEGPIILQQVGLLIKRQQERWLPQEVVDVHNELQGVFNSQGQLVRSLDAREIDSLKRLDTFLDLRNNLLFWKSRLNDGCIIDAWRVGTSPSGFLPDRISTIEELQTAYSALEPGIQRFLEKRAAFINQRRQQKDPGEEQMFLDCLGLTKLPSDLFTRYGELGNIVQFSAAVNKIVALPENIGKLSGVKLLRIPDGKFSTLPRALVKLTRLNECHLEAGCIKELPVEVNEFLNKVRYVSGLPVDNIMIIE